MAFKQQANGAGGLIGMSMGVLNGLFNSKLNSMPEEELRHNIESLVMLFSSALKEEQDVATDA